MKYRSRTEIVAHILEAARKSVPKTHIMYDAYLSYAQLKDYIKVLEASDLLVHDETNQVYRTTNRGLRFLELCEHIEQLTSDENKCK